MLTLLFAILMIVVFAKLIKLAVKMTWGITKILFTLVLLPIVLIGMAISGLIYIALVILIIVGLVSLVASR